MTQIIRAQHPHEILQLAPVLAGGTPRNSALLLLFWQGRTGSAMRVDLPTDDEEADAWAVGAVGSATRVGADAVIVILYHDGDIGAGELPRRALVNALERRATAHELVVRETFIVGTDYWGDFRYPDGPRAPAAEIAELDGRFDGLPEVAELASGEEGTPSELSEEAAQQQRAVVDGLVDNTDPVDATVLTAQAMALDPAELDAVTMAKLSTLAQLPGTREEILTTLIAGAATARLLRSPDDSASVTDLVTSILMGDEKEVSIHRLQRATEFWRTVTARTIPEQLAPVLGILAWLHWATGMCSIGAACAERAIELDPGYSFPRTILELIDSGHLPRWYEEQVRGHAKATAGRSGYHVRSEP